MEIRNIVYILIPTTFLAGTAFLQFSKPLGAFFIFLSIGILSRIIILDIPFGPYAFEVGTLLAFFLALAYGPLVGVINAFLNAMFAGLWANTEAIHTTIIRATCISAAVALFPFLPFSLATSVVIAVLVADVFYIISIFIAQYPILLTAINISISVIWYWRLTVFLAQKILPWLAA